MVNINKLFAVGAFAVGCAGVVYVKKLLDDRKKRQMESRMTAEERQEATLVRMRAAYLKAQSEAHRKADEDYILARNNLPGNHPNRREIFKKYIRRGGPNRRYLTMVDESFYENWLDKHYKLMDIFFNWSRKRWSTPSLVIISEMDEIEPCCICKDDMKSGEVVRSLPCGHNVHHLCMDKWLEKSSTCPLDRESTESILKIKFGLLLDSIFLESIPLAISTVCFQSLLFFCRWLELW